MNVFTSIFYYFYVGYLFLGSILWSTNIFNLMKSSLLFPCHLYLCFSYLKRKSLPNWRPQIFIPRYLLKSFIVLVFNLDLWSVLSWLLITLMMCYLCFFLKLLEVFLMLQFMWNYMKSFRKKLFLILSALCLAIWGKSAYWLGVILFNFF